MRLGPAPLRLCVLATLIALTCGGVAAASAPGDQTVRYGGLSVRVPAGWPVYDLAAAPHTCIRYDRPAVYLGHPGPDQDCPAQAVGRTEALLIEPETAAEAGAGARGRSVLSSSSLGAEQTMTRHVGGVRLSASFAEDESRAASIVGSARWSGSAPSAAPAHASPETPPVKTFADATASPSELPDVTPRPEPRAAAPQNLDDLAAPDAYRTRKLEPAAMFSGPGFDTCAAPSIATMGTWAKSSPFKAAGIYIGGSDRACPDGNLSPAWVRQAAGQGWRLFPIYVGRQAPCWKDPGGGHAALIQHDRRWTQGVEAADDAANRAASFGLAPASTVYFDMEYYPRAVPGCTADVQAFLSAWTDELHKRGFLSGVYSSALGAIADLTAIYDSGAAYRPDVAWFAHWDQKSSLFGDPTLSDRFWPDHRRIKQFAGGHNETYGGVRVNIDSDWLDAPVAALR